MSTKINIDFQETGDRLVIATYVASSAINVILALQVVYYWNATKALTSSSSNKKAAGSKKKRN